MSIGGPARGASNPEANSVGATEAKRGSAVAGTGESLMRAADRSRERERKFAQRKRVNRVALSLSLAAMLFGVFWLVWILWDTVRLGVAGLTWATLTQMTPPPNEAGGLANAIYGSFLMVMLATFAFFWMFVPPFQMSFLIGIDPSLHSALFIGSAQLFGNAAGPILASQFVSLGDPMPAAYVAVTAAVASISMSVVAIRMCRAD